MKLHGTCMIQTLPSLKLNLRTSCKSWPSELFLHAQNPSTQGLHSHYSLAHGCIITILIATNHSYVERYQRQKWRPNFVQKLIYRRRVVALATNIILLPPLLSEYWRRPDHKACPCTASNVKNKNLPGYLSIGPFQMAATVWFAQTVAVLDGKSLLRKANRVV